jgi:hypothetical protein
MPGDETVSCEAVVPDHARAVHGHFRADAHSQFLDAFRVTFMRDPVERFISGYFYWLVIPANGDRGHDQFLKDRPDVVTFARHAGSVLSPYFAGVDTNCFDYVGFADRRTLDFRVLSRILGFPLDCGVHVNRTVLPLELEAQRQEVETSPRIQGELRDALREDYEHYDLFRSHWA